MCEYVVIKLAHAACKIGTSAAQSADARLGSSTLTIQRRQSIQAIKSPAVVLNQAAHQSEGQRYRILLEVLPCFQCK